MDQTETPFVSVVMPALNEERYIARALLSLADIEGLDYEILVMDGGSTDYTVEIVRQLMAQNARIKLHRNEKRIQSAAMNQAAQLADPRARYLVRADCHAQYPARFVEACVEDLRTRDAASVVVPMQTVGVACFQRAVAAAQNSRLGNGGAAHRRQGESRYVDHGHHAGFRRDAFAALGGYDETFTHNEDAELDVRLRRAGGRIWLNTEAAVRYFPRSSARALARQYWRHGQGRASTALKHRMALKPRQLLPLFATAASLLGLVLGAALHPAFLLVPAAYVAMTLLAGLVIGVRAREACAAATGFAALIMHTSWALGFASRWVEAKREGRRNPVIAASPGPILPNRP